MIGLKISHHIPANQLWLACTRFLAFCIVCMVLFNIMIGSFDLRTSVLIGQSSSIGMGCKTLKGRYLVAQSRLEPVSPFCFFPPQYFPWWPSRASAILCPDWSTHQHLSKWTEHWSTWYDPFESHRGRNSSLNLGSLVRMRSRRHWLISKIRRRHQITGINRKNRCTVEIHMRRLGNVKKRLPTK